MNEPLDPDETRDELTAGGGPDAGDAANPTFDFSSLTADSLEVGLAAAFGRSPGPPRSSIGDTPPVLLKEAEGESSLVVKPTSDAMPSKDETGDRYQLSGDIARGGMGAVLRGRDVDLGRDLAVKVLLDKHANRPDVARRFIEEAQICGQLQHPGIVPVYDIGRFGDRPFFSMKLVKGHTLSAILAERTDPAADRPRLLGIALQVAQAMAYAHAKGVIHRDLKPANIMVGAFGEVQVMDWGLAKVLAEGGIHDEERASRAHHQEPQETVIRTARSTGAFGSSGAETETGSVLGTPAYMPPEQASGDIPNLDRRAVAEAREHEERKRRKVQLALATSVLTMILGIGAFAFWRNEQAQIGRQRDARNAEAVAGLLGQAEESLQAGDAAKATAALEAAKNRSAEGGAEEEAKRLGRLDADLALLRELDAADQFRWNAISESADDAAVATRTRDVLKRFGVDPDAASLDGAAALVSASVVRDRIVPALDRLLRQEKSAAVRARLTRVDAHPYRDPVRDMILTGNPAKITELVGQQAALEQPPGFVAFLGQNASIPVERRRQLLQAAVIRRPADLSLLMTLGETYPGYVKETVDQRLRWYQAAVAAAPANSSALFSLAMALSDSGQRDEAIACYRKATELDPECGGTYINLGNLLKGAGQLDEALACFKKAAEVWPQAAPFHARLAFELTIRGELDEAIACYKKAVEAAKRNVELAPKVVGPDYAYDICALTWGNGINKGDLDKVIACFERALELDSKLACAHYTLGLARAQQGQLDEAIACYKKAVELDPKSARARSSLGAALYDKGRLDEAIACYKKAIELGPKDAYAHHRLGILLTNQGKLDEAIPCFKEAIELDPKNATTHNHLGMALKGKGQFYEAIDRYRKAIELDPKLALAHANLGFALVAKGHWAEATPCLRKATELDPKLANAHHYLGIALSNNGQLDDAIACYKKAVELDPKDAEAYSNLGKALEARGRLYEAIACWKKAVELDPKLANAHSYLGVALKEKGQLNESIACFRKAIELEPKNGAAHSNLGTALALTGQLDEAIACFKKAIELAPKSAILYYNLSGSLYQEGQLDEAIASMSRAIELDPKFASAHSNLGKLLYNKGQLDEAIARYKKAIELDPKDPDNYINLGLTLYNKGQFDEAIASYKNAIELEPNLAQAHNDLGAILCDFKGDYDGATACFRKAIQFDPKNAYPHFNLGNALKAKGQLDEAIACYKKAIELDAKLAEARKLLARAERSLAVREKLPHYQNGTYTPASSDERLGLAEWCKIKKLNHAAAGLYASAFAAEPKLADDLEAGHRYSAACYAALAAAGHGEDAAKLDGTERTRLRKQALDWLRADLALRIKQLDTGRPTDRAEVQQTMRHWQMDTDLAGIRNAAALAKLPADERKACTQLWADVAALLKNAEQKPK